MQNSKHYNQTLGDDVITQLPVDKTTPTHEELQIVNTLFKKHGGNIKIMFNEAKDAVLVGIIYILFSLPQLDDYIKKFLPITTKSVYFLLLIKVVFAIILYWVVKHFYLSRKNTSDS
jgi:hypothetical protein